jgi:hypothetical protein
MSQPTNQTGSATIRQQQAQTASSGRDTDSAPGDRRGNGLHPQTREALAQAVKRAAAQAKRR